MSVVFSVGFRDLAITIKEGEVATLVIQQIGDDKGGKNVGGLPEEQIGRVVLQRSSGSAAIPGQYCASVNFCNLVQFTNFTKKNNFADPDFQTTPIHNNNSLIRYFYS